MAIQIVVEGANADTALQKLLAMPGIEGNVESAGEEQKEGTLATIATIVGITIGAIEIGEKMHKWYHRAKEVRSNQTFEVVIETPKHKLLLEDASIEDIVKALKTLE